MEKKVINEYFEKTIDELYIEIGKSEHKPIFLGASEPSEKTLQKIGLDFLRNNVGLICSKLESSNIIKKYISDPKSIGRVELIGAVADLFITLSNEKSIFLLSIIIIRQGILQTCKPYGYFK